VSDLVPPVDLDQLSEVGPAWGLATAELNGTALSWGPGQGGGERVNAERDVLTIANGGSGTVKIDEHEYATLPHHALLIEQGARRRITAGTRGLPYVSVHQRRGPPHTELLAGSKLHTRPPSDELSAA
jgi:hypothetical protein